jgi:hypothetical protein
MDIFRGRYRESLETPKPIAADQPLLYRWALPTANHVFLPGHRIMVQVQSSWFPLYDRNPQTFVSNIFWAKPGDYRKATQRIYHAPGQMSFVEPRRLPGQRVRFSIYHFPLFSVSHCEGRAALPQPHGGKALPYQTTILLLREEAPPPESEA